MVELHDLDKRLPTNTAILESTIVYAALFASSYRANSAAQFLWYGKILEDLYNQVSTFRRDKKRNWKY